MYNLPIKTCSPKQAASLNDLALVLLHADGVTQRDFVYQALLLFSMKH